LRLDPLQHTIIATDVERSSSRSDALLVQMRRDLWEILGDTLARQDIDIAGLTRIDDGDGFRLLLPARISPHAALDPFIGRLGIELRLHRTRSSEANRLRLRVAIHAGLLHSEPGGTYTGTPLKDCARLLDAQAGRDLLQESPRSDLVLLVSESFYNEVVRNDVSLDPAAFRRIPVQVKETDAYAWAYLPEGAQPATPPPPAPGRPPESGGRGVTIIGNGHTFGNVFGGDRNG